eukprot:jgi/Botrbrau1/9762/Bobra.85_1s0013.1
MKKCSNSSYYRVITGFLNIGFKKCVLYQFKGPVMVSRRVTVTRTGFESAKCSGRIRVIMVLLDKVSWKVQYGKCAW